MGVEEALRAVRDARLTSELGRFLRVRNLFFLGGVYGEDGDRRSPEGFPRYLIQAHIELLILIDF